MARSIPTTIPRSFDRVRISCGKISCYRETYPDPPTIEQKLKQEQNLCRGNYNGTISHKTKIKCKDLICNWIDSYSHYFFDKRKFRRNFHHQFTFVTLTLPAGTFLSDQEIRKKAVKPFIQQLIRKHQVFNYFYRAEPTNSLRYHGHLILDKSIDHTEIRQLWNKYMAYLGLIEDYRINQEKFHENGFRARPELFDQWPLAKQKLAYLKGKKENWSNPNSTDIHQLKHVNNVKNYVTKYMTKGQQSRPMGGRLWGCSDSLRQVKPITINLSYRLKQVLQQLADEAGSEVFATDFNWTIWRFDLINARDQYPTIETMYKNFIAHCIRILYPLGVCTELELMQIRSEAEYKMSSIAA